MTYPIATFCMLLAAACACSSAKSDTEQACPGVDRKALMHASSEENYLGISEAEQRALVEIMDADAGDGIRSEPRVCSGVFIAPEWVLTAQHCTQIAPAIVRVSANSTHSAATLGVLETRLHPTLDLALFKIDFASVRFDSVPPSAEPALNAGGLGIAPLSLGYPGATELRSGTPVELAGYGLSETQFAGELRFLVESVVDSNSEEITVDGFGKSGACDGDSGGPLLVRDPSGRVAVVGVLSIGSRSCLGTDHYLRVDVVGVGDWIQDTTGGYLSGPPECGKISSRGRCLYGEALWCEGATLHATACGLKHQCGFSPESNGFRCIGASSPCPDTDAIGACRNNSAVRCIDEQLVTEACGACSVCRVAGATGTPYCN